MIDTGERLIPEGNQQTLTYGEHISRYLSLTNLVAGKDVLDVASGSGYGSQLLAKGAKSVKGLDYFLEAVDYAKERYPAENLEFNHGNAEDMPFEEKSFDVVVSLETIEHLKHPDKFIQEVRRVLKDNGIFVVSTPNDDEFMDGNEYHLHEFQFEELSTLINKNFKNNEYYYQGTYFAASMFSKDHFTSPISSTDLRVESTFGSDTSKAIYFIAIASNSESPLPSLDQNIVLSDKWSTKDDIDRNGERNAEKKELTEALSKYQNDSVELQTIKSSKAWKFITTVRKIKDKVRPEKGTL